MSYANLIEPDAGHASNYSLTPAARPGYQPSYAARPDRVMFEPGDEVRVRQLGEAAPRMVVKQAVKVPHETEEGRTRLIGILCFWYVRGEEYCEQLFNTKDLEVLNKSRKD